MKETRLGDFEEAILLITGILGETAYALKITEEFRKQTNRSVSIGMVHSALTRLSDKGFLSSEMGRSTPERGGRRKRIYTVTAIGQRALEASRDFRMTLWNQYPGFQTGSLSISII